MMTPDSAPAVKDKTNPSKEERCTGYVRENVSPPALFAYMGRPAMTPDSLRTPIVRTGARGGQTRRRGRYSRLGRLQTIRPCGDRTSRADGYLSVKKKKHAAACVVFSTANCLMRKVVCIINQINYSGVSKCAGILPKVPHQNNCA